MEDGWLGLLRQCQETKYTHYYHCQFGLDFDEPHPPGLKTRQHNDETRSKDLDSGSGLWGGD